MRKTGWLLAAATLAALAGCHAPPPPAPPNPGPNSTTPGPSPHY